MRLKTVKREAQNDLLTITLVDNELPNIHFINNQLCNRFDEMSLVEIIRVIRKGDIEIYYGPNDIAELVNNLQDDFMYTLQQARVIITWIEDVRGCSEEQGYDWPALYVSILNGVDA